MRRREFLGGLGCAAVGCPLTARAQQIGKAKRIGLLRVGPPPPSFIGPLQASLRGLGYVEGKNLIVELGIAKEVPELPALAAELVHRKVDVLVASGTPAVIPARMLRARLQ